MKTAAATLPEIVFGTLRSINGLESIKPENCCECIVFCEDTMQYLIQREKVSPSDEAQAYQKLEDQIINLCSNRTALQNRALTCSLRDIYTLKIEFEGKEMRIADIFKQKDAKEKPLEYVLLKNSSHTTYPGVRISLSELRQTIKEKGWPERNKDGKLNIHVAPANLPFAVIYGGVN